LVKYLAIQEKLYSCLRKLLFQFLFRGTGIFLITALFNFSIASATNYYVSSTTGNDSSDGKSEATAWVTILKINGKTFKPGDSILFKRGDVWRETLIVPSSGSSDAYIVFASYGKGVNPKIIGSVQALSWTNQGGNIWKSETSLTDPYTVGKYGAEVFFENADGSVSWGTHKTSANLCISEYNWTCNSNRIFIYSPDDPSARYASVEVPQRTNSINLNDKNYLRFEGIDIFYVVESGYTYKTYPMQSQTGLVIENSKIGYVSIKNSELGYGIDASYSDMIVRGCEIHDCGRRGISFHVYGSFTIKNILVENNYFHDGFHTTGTDFSVGSSSSYLSHFDGVIIRKNLFYDPPTGSGNANQIFIQNYRYAQLDATIKNLYIYSNIFISPSQASIQMEGTQSVYIYNNTFYNHNSAKSGNTAHVWVDNNNSSVKVVNNIFYTDLNNDSNGNGGELFVVSGQDSKKVEANYNLYFRINNNLRIVEKENSGIYHMNDIALIRSALGWEINSPAPANPLFTGAAKNDFKPASGSPAIGSGINLNLPVDYNGNSFNSVKPSIGAIEGNTENNSSGSDSTGHIIILYPNPSHGELTVLRKGSDPEKQYFKIISMSGEIVYENYLDAGARLSNFQLNINSGIYIVEVLSGNMTIMVQKLIVVYPFRK
jgi:hypothetical protein